MPGVACRVEHWRAQPKVGSFRSPLFRLWSGFLIRPSPTFPAAPPKIPYGGFSPVRLQAQAPRSAVCRFPLRSPHLSLIPDIPAEYRTFTQAFATAVHQPGCPPLCADLWRCPSPLSPEVLAPAGLCCPCLPRLATSSASLETSGSFPSMAGYSDGLWHSRVLLPGLHTFRTSPAVLSRIAVCSFRRESGTCISPASVPALAIGEREETLGTSNIPASSSARGPNFDGWFVRSRYGPPGCSPPGLIRPSQCSACLRLLHPGFQPSSHPEDCRI